MPGNDSRGQTPIVPEPSEGGALYLIVGALDVALLVGGYFLVGAPGLHTNIAQLPERNDSLAVEQPRSSAPVVPTVPATARQ